MKPSVPKCPRCGSRSGIASIRATGQRRLRWVDGTMKRQAEATCGFCGWRWWSVHPALVRQSK